MSNSAPAGANRRAIIGTRLGIIGGTFDPVHIGHLILAEEARAALSLDRVVFLPAAQPWRKAGSPVSPAAERLAMVRLAIADNPQFEVSTAEIERSGPTYTADTLEHLHERVPEADLWFILGSDALLDLPNWKDPHRILAQARLAVACRAPLAPERLAEVERLVPGVRSHTDFVPMPQVSVSSSELRQRLRAGVSTRYWLPAPVERYAVERGLYVRGE